MSVAEQLERLQVAMDDWGPEVLEGALPEIIAVVKAAEDRAQAEPDLTTNKAHAEAANALSAALSALDEQLGDVT